MTRDIFMALKQRLMLPATGLKQVEWYMDQYAEGDDDNLVWITPAAYIEFEPVDWQQLGSIGHQDAELTVKIHVVSDTSYEDSKRITVHKHLDIDRSIYIMLQGFWCFLSFLPDYAGLENTENDSILLNRMTRITSTSDHTLRRLMVTTQTYKVQINDVALQISVGEENILANLDLAVVKVNQLN